MTVLCRHCGQGIRWSESWSRWLHHFVDAVTEGHRPEPIG